MVGSKRALSPVPIYEKLAITLLHYSSNFNIVCGLKCALSLIYKCRSKQLWMAVRKSNSTFGQMSNPSRMRLKMSSSNLIAVLCPDSNTNRRPLFDQKVTTLSSENEVFESYHLVLNGLNSLVLILLLCLLYLKISEQLQCSEIWVEVDGNHWDLGGYQPLKTRWICNYSTINKQNAHNSSVQDSYHNSSGMLHIQASKLVDDLRTLKYNTN